MSAPLFFLPDGALASAVEGAVLLLDGAEGRHAATVRRIGVGERVDVADGEGQVARCVVDRADPGALLLRVLVLAAVPAPQPRLVLVQALAKGGRDELAVETATELGVDVVVPWQAARCVVQWRAERGAKARDRWQQTARTAAKQSRRPKVPVVTHLAGGAEVRRMIGAAALALVLHGEATRPLAGLQLPEAGDVLLVVGPEGGISPEELTAFAAAGAVVARLGDTVLRSSTAGPAAIAVLSAATRWR